MPPLIFGQGKSAPEHDQTQAKYYSPARVKAAQAKIGAQRDDQQVYDVVEGSIHGPVPKTAFGTITLQEACLPGRKIALTSLTVKRFVALQPIFPDAS
jgi:hypothetical protein